MMSHIPKFIRARFGRRKRLLAAVRKEYKRRFYQQAVDTMQFIKRHVTSDSFYT